VSNYDRNREARWNRTKRAKAERAQIDREMQLSQQEPYDDSVLLEMLAEMMKPQYFAVAKQEVTP
jgi:hypothetical protein